MLEHMKKRLINILGLSKYTKDELHGMSLSGAMERECVSVEKLSIITGIAENTIKRMEAGEISIDIDEAEKFGKALNANPKAFCF